MQMQKGIFFDICLIYIFGARYKKINKHQRFFVSFAYLIFYSSLRDKNMMERLSNVNISFTNKNKRIFYGLASSNNIRSNQIKICFMVLIIQHNAKITMYGMSNETKIVDGMYQKLTKLFSLHCHSIYIQAFLMVQIFYHY